MAQYWLSHPWFDPWPDLGDLHRRMDRLFERASGPALARGSVFPPVNLYETSDGYVLTAEVPGLGTRLDVSFSLPRSGVLRLDSEIAYQLVPDLGIVFNGTSPGVRDAIRGYVQDALANR